MEGGGPDAVDDGGGGRDRVDLRGDLLRCVFKFESIYVYYVLILRIGRILYGAIHIFTLFTLELPLTLLMSVHGEQPLHNHTSPLSSLTSDELHLKPPRNPSHLVPCGISMAGALILQLRDTMSLIKADLGSVCVQ